MKRPRVEVGPQGPTLTDDDQQFLQALRNVWPILSPKGRRQATEAANKIKGQ